jgi:hypothetical protein
VSSRGASVVKSGGAFPSSPARRMRSGSTSSSPRTPGRKASVRQGTSSSSRCAGRLPICRRQRGRLRDTPGGFPRQSPRGVWGSLGLPAWPAPADGIVRGAEQGGVVGREDGVAAPDLADASAPVRLDPIAGPAGPGEDERACSAGLHEWGRTERRQSMGGPFR